MSLASYVPTFSSCVKYGIKSSFAGKDHSNRKFLKNSWPLLLIYFEGRVAPRSMDVCKTIIISSKLWEISSFIWFDLKIEN